jgi:aryl-alcohol dehydrogenase-like predicted oxidoreductase
MVFQNYNNSKLNVSRLAVGTASFGSKVGKNKAFQILNQLEESKVNYIDTASSYGLGMSEKIIGEFIQHRRGQYFLSTKVGIKAAQVPTYKKLLMPIVRKIYHLPFVNSMIKKQSSGSYDKSILALNEIDESVKQSFKNLRTDYIDQLLLHNNFNAYLEDPSVFDYLQGLKSRFLVGSIGVTTDVIDEEIIKNIHKNSDKIDTLQMPFKHHALVNFANKPVNYFSIFSANTNAHNELEAFKKSRGSDWKGHFIVAMSSSTHINQNIQDFSF